MLQTSEEFREFIEFLLMLLSAMILENGGQVWLPSKYWEKENNPARRHAITCGSDEAGRIILTLNKIEPGVMRDDASPAH